MSAGAQYDYQLGVGFNPTDVQRVNTVLNQIAQRVAATQSSMTQRISSSAVRSVTRAAGPAATQAITAATQTTQAQAAAATTATRRLTVATHGLGGAWQQVNRDVTHALGKIALWGIATTAIYGGLQALRAVVQTISEIDFAITGLRKVYQGSTTDINHMTEAAIRMGRELGAPIAETIDTMRDWARQGYLMNDILVLTRTALIAQNIAEMDSASATRYLTAAINQFNLSAQEAMVILDTWNELSNRYAATTEGIAQGVIRLGRTAYDAGVSLQMASAMVAVLMEETKRSGQEIGTALRTIFTYVYREQNIKALQDVGIYVRRQGGDLLSLIDIISELSIKWGALTDAQRQAIAQVFGVRRVTEFRTLLDSLPKIFEANRVAIESHGSALKENELFLDSVHVKWQRFTASLQGLVWSRNARNALKDLISLLQVLIDVIDRLGLGWTAALLLMSPLLVRINLLRQAFQALWVVMATGQAVQAGAIVNMNRMSAAAYGLAAAIRVLWTSLSLLSKILVVIGIAVAAYQAVSYIARGRERRTQAIEESIAARREFLTTQQEQVAAIEAHTKALGDNFKRLDDLEQKYKELGDSSTRSSAAIEQQTRILEQAFAITGDQAFQVKNNMIPAMDLLTNAFERNRRKIIEWAISARQEWAKVLDAIAQTNRLIALEQERLMRERETDLRLALMNVQAQRAIAEMYPLREEEEPAEAPGRPYDKETLRELVAIAEDELAVTDELAGGYRELLEAATEASRAVLDHAAAQTAAAEAEKAAAETRGRTAEEMLGIGGAGPGAPDPLGDAARRSARAWESAMRAARNAVREIGQAIETVNAEMVGPWYQGILRVQQRFQDLRDRGVDALARIKRALDESKLTPAQQQALIGQQTAIVDLLDLLDTEKVRVFWDEWAYGITQARGGTAAIEARLQRQIEALNAVSAAQMEAAPDQEDLIRMNYIVQLMRLFALAADDSAQIRERQARTETQIARSLAGPSWELSIAHFASLSRESNAALENLREQLSLFGKEFAMETIAADIAEIAIKSEKSAQEIRGALAAWLLTQDATRRARHELSEVIASYRIYRAEKSADVVLTTRLRVEEANRVMLMSDLAGMVDVVRDEINAREDLLDLLYDYRVALIEGAGASLFDLQAAQRARFEETTSLQEQITLWSEMTQRVREYDDWVRGIIGRERRAGMRLEIEQTLDRIAELQQVMTTEVPWSDPWMRAFEDLHGIATSFLDDWNRQIIEMGENVADALATGIETGGPEIREAFQHLFNQIGRIWLTAMIHRYMGGMFENLAAMAARAAGEPTGPEGAAATGVMGMMFPGMRGPASIAQLGDQIQAAVDMWDDAIEKHGAMLEEQIARSSQAATALDILRQAARAAADMLFGLAGGSVTARPPADGTTTTTVPMNRTGAILNGSTSAAGMFAAASYALAGQMARNTAAILANTSAVQTVTEVAEEGARTGPGVGPGGARGKFWDTKWGQGITAGYGLYAAYRGGDILGGAVSGYSLATLVGSAFGPYGAILGAMVGKKGKRRRDTSDLQKRFAGFWSPADVMWSTTPFFEAMGYPAYAAGRQATGRMLSWSQTPITAFEPYAAAPTFGHPLWGAYPGRMIQIQNPVIQIISSGSTEVDAQRLWQAIEHRITRNVQREEAAGRRVPGAL